MNNHHAPLTKLPSDLQGLEFDWFAVDNAGELAIFATGGEGLISASVAAHYREHSDAGELFETPNIGTSKIWNDYAAYGLYVYDWDIPDGSAYHRQAVPQGKIPEHLRERLLGIGNLPRFDGLFSKRPIIAEWV